MEILIIISFVFGAIGWILFALETRAHNKTLYLWSQGVDVFEEAWEHHKRVSH